MKSTIKDTPNQGQFQLPFIEELWKPIEGYEGHYSISNHGRVMSHKEYAGVPNRILKIKITKYGYRMVDFTMGTGNRKGFRVNRLVALHFIPNPENKRCVNHIDSNRENDHVSNLNWMTHQENSNHAVENQSFPRGEEHFRTKFGENEVRQIRLKYSTGKYTCIELSKEYGVNESSIGKIANGVTWGHVNYYPGLPEREQRHFISKKSHYYS